MFCSMVPLSLQQAPTWRQYPGFSALQPPGAGSKWALAGSSGHQTTEHLLGRWPNQHELQTGNLCPSLAISEQVAACIPHYMPFE